MIYLILPTAVSTQASWEGAEDRKGRTSLRVHRVPLDCSASYSPDPPVRTLAGSRRCHLSSSNVSSSEMATHDMPHAHTSHEMTSHDATISTSTAGSTGTPAVPALMRVLAALLVVLRVLSVLLVLLLLGTKLTPSALSPLP